MINEIKNYLTFSCIYKIVPKPYQTADLKKVNFNEKKKCENTAFPLNLIVMVYEVD